MIDRLRWPLPVAVGLEGSEKFAIIGDLLGRLHTLPSDGSVSRPGGASGDDPRSEGSPRQDLLATLAFLDPVVAAAERERFVCRAYLVAELLGGQALPEALLHSNLLHAPDHVNLGAHGPVAINFAWLM